MREFLIMALIIMMITPHVEAIRDSSSMAHPSEDTLNQLIKMSTDEKEGNQIIDSANPEKPNPVQHGENIFLNNQSKRSIDKSIDYYINHETDTSKAYGDNDEFQKAYFSVIGSNLDSLPERMKEDDHTLGFVRIAASNAASDVGHNFGALYERGTATDFLPSDKQYPSDSNASHDIRPSREAAYESSTVYHPISDTTQIASSNVIRDIDSNVDYTYESTDAYNNFAGTTRIASSNVISDIDSKVNYVYESDSYGNFVRATKIANADLASNIGSNLNTLYEKRRIPATFSSEVPAVGHNQNPILNNLNQIAGKNIYAQERTIDYYNLRDNISLKKGKKAANKKNHAIVIGIDEYKDRSDLHTSVNDANTIASLLELYGYDVTMLTDKTPNKPTKYNILEVALAEIKQRDDGGNVIIYFSGHGYLDKAGDYYLVPQDANGAKSTYISMEELNQYIRDVKNLAIIIDACNSGALCSVTGEGQLMLASSKINEPSNEEWMGSLSVFTRKLCDAIKEQGRKSSKILLQSCFYEAYNGTIIWSQGHILSQTPMLKDMTPSEKYYLN